MGPVFCFNKGFIGHLWGYIWSVWEEGPQESLLKDQKEHAVGTSRKFSADIKISTVESQL